MEFASMRGILLMALLGMTATVLFMAISPSEECPGTPIVAPHGTPIESQPQVAPAPKKCIEPIGGKSWNHPDTMNAHNWKITSQNGEDGIQHWIFDNIGTTNRYYVEFGTEDGSQCNTRFLREQAAWWGLMMDGGFNNTLIGQHQHFITPENINHLFELHDVPYEFDLLSIDVDYDDFYVWNAIHPHYRPRVVVIEYNAHVGDSVNVATDPNDSRRWQRTKLFGSSMMAIALMGRKKGYTLLCSDMTGVNLFFLRNDIFDCQGLQPYAPAQLYHPITHGGQVPEPANTDRRWVLEPLPSIPSWCWTIREYSTECPSLEGVEPSRVAHLVPAILG